jgi:exodeoxyribonuclease VII large subunit
MPAPGPALPPARPASQAALTVSQLNRAARQLLEEGFPDLWVEGEVSRFLAHGSGHWYFTLKDEAAAVKAVMFRGANRACRVRPQEGMRVLVRCRVSLYEPKGDYQVLVDHLEAAGEGALLLKLEQLKRRLAEEGLFDAARKRPLPLLPRRIGVATSPTGAALRDILKVLETRDARVHVVIAPCRVQGEGAALEIARALALLDARGDLDAVIVGRGGGSLEDLWAFNEEVVVRAICAMSVPVVSAVGHEIDTTLADLAADVRAATPSQAAEIISASTAEVEDAVSGSVRRLRQAMRAACAGARSRLARVEPRQLALRVRGRVERAAQRADQASLRLRRCAAQEARHRRLVLAGLVARLQPRQLLAATRRRREGLAERVARLAVAVRARAGACRQRASAVDSRLRALSPLAVLQRGYAVLAREDGRVVRAHDEVTRGESLAARLARGRLVVRVEHARGD